MLKAFFASVTLAENDDSSAWNFDILDLLIYAISFLQL